MIPETDDGRVLFVLPWEDHALVGTTDEPAQICDHPRPLEEEINYLLRHVTRYFNLEVGRKDVKAVWSGLRPLVSDPEATDTAQLARDHVIEDSPSGLLTIAGGKWTTYRKMALDVVEHAMKIYDLTPPRPHCQTERLPLIGSADYQATGHLQLIEKYGLAEDIANYLNRNYGDQADKVAELATRGYAARLVENHPIIEAEIVFAARHELAERAIDALARRTPLALLDTEASLQASGRIVEIMAAELNWDENRCRQELDWTEKRLHQAI